MEKNFEITIYLLGGVRQYAKFFHVADKTMMSILFAMGDSLCNKIEDFMFRSTSISRHEKIKLLEQDFMSYLGGKEYDELKGHYKSEEDFLREYNKAKKMEKTLKRRKLKMTEEQYKKIKDIVKNKSNDGEKICDSDVICFLISKGLDKLKYLKYKPDWRTNLCVDKEFKAPKEICTTIPNAFYMCIENRAQELDIGVSDYIKILIEEKFDADKEKMVEQIRERVDQRKRH